MIFWQHQIETAAGVLHPLTAERFKLCELFAELLHCSHMALVNRPSSPDNPSYDAAGLLEGSYDSLEKLQKVLQPISREIPGMSADGAPATPKAETPHPPPVTETDQISESVHRLNIAKGSDPENTAEVSNEVQDSDARSSSPAAQQQQQQQACESAGLRFRQEFLQSNLVNTFLVSCSWVCFRVLC